MPWYGAVEAVWLVVESWIRTQNWLAVVVVVVAVIPLYLRAGSLSNCSQSSFSTLQYLALLIKLLGFNLKVFTFRYINVYQQYPSSDEEELAFKKATWSIFQYYELLISNQCSSIGKLACNLKSKDLKFGDVIAFKLIVFHCEHMCFLRC